VRIRCLRDTPGRRPVSGAVGGAHGSYVSSIENVWVLGSPEPLNSGRVEVALPTFEQCVGCVDGRPPEPYSRQHRRARQNDARRASYRAALGSTSKPKVATASSMSARWICSSE
jgi:hypothetical protein